MTLNKIIFYSLDFKSLADTPPVLVGFNNDHGRVCSISSSPRVDEDHAQKQTSREIRYQRIIRWDDTLMVSKTRPTEGKTNEMRRETGVFRFRPRTRNQFQSSSSFRTCERGQDQISVRLNRAVIAPPPGHYDVSYEVVSQRRDILGLITPMDRPNAPSCVFDRSTRTCTGPKDTCLGLLQTGKTSVVCAVDTIGTQTVSPRTALKKIRTFRQTSPTNQAVLAPPAENLKSSVTATGPDSVLEDTSQKVNTRKGEERPVTKRFHIAEQDLKAWLFPAKTMRMEKLVARVKSTHNHPHGRSTATGYFSDPAWRSPDVWYRPNYESLPVQQRHIASPDLQRGGRDSDNYIQRLGFRLPQEAAEEHGAAAGHREWISGRSGSSKARGLDFAKITGRDAAGSHGDVHSSASTASVRHW